eukprot:8748399-Alexandrium_andersonii.AAC.1
MAPQPTAGVADPARHSGPRAWEPTHVRPLLQKIRAESCVSPACEQAAAEADEGSKEASGNTDEAQLLLQIQALLKGHGGKLKALAEAVDKQIVAKPAKPPPKPQQVFDGA